MKGYPTTRLCLGPRIILLSQVISPLVKSYSPYSNLRSVLLPHPLSPIKARCSPLLTSKEMFQI